ncbi:glycosyltransferase, partial [Rhodococcus erythropolis]|nr:glycosyltransferase [Rhodococcus erythropolis]
MTTTSNHDDFAVLVVAKAPVPGLAKTRLAADVGDRAAAEIAAAALLDTLQVVAATPARNRIVAITGDLTDAVRGADVRDALKDF